MSLIQEFHSDHQKVVVALCELRQAIANYDVPGVRKILGCAENLVGPHFKFEELYLYPALERFLGESYTKKLYNEHDGVFRSIRRIAHLAQNDTWSEVEQESAKTNLELVYEHPIACDGLSLWMEKLGEREQEGLFQKMCEVREQATPLSEYYRERQNA
jgi:hypothetical protein